MVYIKSFFVPTKRRLEKMPLSSIIYALNARLQHKLYMMVLGMIDESRHNIFNIYIFTAMCIMMDTWELLPATLTSDGWCASGVPDGEK